MWNPSLLKSIWPDWRIKRTIDENSYRALYEVEEKGLGEVSRSTIQIISLSPEDDLFEKIREQVNWGESSFNQKLSKSLQKILQDIKRLKDRSFGAPVLHVDEVELLRDEERVGWHLLQRQEFFPTLAEVQVQKPMSEAEVLKLGLDLSRALDLYEDLELVHGAIHEKNIFVTPSGDYKLGGLSLLNYLDEEIRPLFLGELSPVEKNAYARTQEEDLVALGRVLKGALPSNAQGSALGLVLSKASSSYPEERYRSSYDLRRDLEKIDLDASSQPVGEEPQVSRSTDNRPAEQEFVRKSSTTSSPVVKKKSTSSFLIIGLLALVVIFGIVAAYFMLGSSLSKGVSLDKIPQIENRNFVPVEKGELITITLSGGNKVEGRYYGEMKDGKPDGQGAFMSIEKDNRWIYSGGWKDGLYHGEGKFVREDGTFYYEGGTKEGKAEGQGILYNVENGEYQGEFKDDYYHGKGKFKFTNGDQYEGDYDMDYRHGKGTYTWSNGDVYTGDIVKDVHEGKGKMTFAGFGTYEGDIQNNKLHGKGIYTWLTGDVYDGDWVEGKRQGKGILRFANGNSYDGDFKEDFFDGYGTFTWADGGSYAGDWVKDKKHGQGVEIWPDGATYMGEYVEGKMQGKGKHIFANGDIYEGQFENDMLHGEGIYTWADGDVFKGSYKEGKRNGTGVLTDASGQVLYSGNWVDDNFVGE